jgi:uroporphyrinogen III methyltransferase/synthase
VDREIGRLARYDTVVFTSAAAVDAFLRRAGKRTDFPPAAAVGPATARALKERGIRPSWVARKFTAAELGRKLRGRVLHPASQPRSPDLAREARKRGAVVVEPVVYRIVRTRAGGVPKTDLVTFASAETVRSFAESSASRGTCACIGPVTARAAREAGFKVAAQPSRYTIPDLIKAIVAWHRRRTHS